MSFSHDIFKIKSCQGEVKNVLEKNMNCFKADVTMFNIDTQSRSVCIHYVLHVLQVGENRNLKKS